MLGFVVSVEDDEWAIVYWPKLERKVWAKLDNLALIAAQPAKPFFWFRFGDIVKCFA